MNFFFREEEEEHTFQVHVSDIPWLWIGATTSDDITTTVTLTVNRSLTYGTRVTPEYLSKVTDMNDVVHWSYLDPQELVEKDFPSEGFLIEHVGEKTDKVSDSGYSPESD